MPNSPAAADNGTGTGTALVLAAARHLRGVECRRYDVMFCLFDEEENGPPQDSYAQIDFAYLATGSALVHRAFGRLLNPDAE